MDTELDPFNGGEEQEIESSQVQIAPVPRVSIQAFCETSDVAEIIEDAITDRRMAKAHMKVHMGGIEGAIEAFASAPTPNVIVIESTSDRDHILAKLDDLAELCDAGTKVTVIGRYNDITLYRELMARGVSDYLVAPIDVLTFIKSLSELYANPEAEPLGKVLAIVGAKGGVGASSIGHNLAWAISRDFDLSTVIADLDLGFGTAGLDFNQDPPQGIAEAVFAPDRLDSALLDRLLSKCTERLSILAAPATLDRVYDFGENAFDGLVDLLRASVPLTVLDVPHSWNSWTRHVLVAADDVVIVAAPDLANLRNAKNIIDTLRAQRPHDSKPKLIMNMVGLQKRPEIPVADFAKALETEPVGTISFDAKLFGTAANNGQMLAEVEPSNKSTQMIADIAGALMGRADLKKGRAAGSLLSPLLSRFKRQKAS